MSELIKLPTAGLVILKDNTLLLAYSKNKQAWYLPGGKVDLGEDAKTALLRESLEELNLTLAAERLSDLFHVSAPAYGEAKNVVMEQDCFLYDLQNDAISANEEIEAIRYFSLADYEREAIQVPGVLIVYALLAQRGLIHTQ